MSKDYTVEQLLELAHKHRALHIKVGPLEVQLAPDAFAPTSAPMLPEERTLPEEFRKMPSPEEFQFMHSPISESPEPS